MKYACINQVVVDEARLKTVLRAVKEALHTRGNLRKTSVIKARINLSCVKPDVKYH